MSPPLPEPARRRAPAAEDARAMLGAPGSPAGPFGAYRMDALAFVAGGIAHDLANPLGAILAFASYLATDPRLPADLRDDAHLLKLEAQRTHRMVGALLELIRERPPAESEVGLDTVLDEVLELGESLLAEVAVERDIPAELPPVRSDPSLLRHLVLVLSVEAMRALGPKPARGRLRLGARLTDGGTVVGTIAYEGRPGGSEVDVDDAGTASPKAVDPARRDGPLEAAEQVAARMGAHLRFEPDPGGGRFVLQLPVARQDAPGASADVADVSAADFNGPDERTPRATVLVCDDDHAVRSLIRRLLDRGGYRTLEAASGPEAMEILASGSVDVVLSDHQMAVMSGIELFERVVERWPALRGRFVLMSGDAGADDITRFAGGSGVAVLAKPFEMRTLEDTVRRAASR